jgi:putative CocE/NonD family hydrolase
VKKFATALVVAISLVLSPLAGHGASGSQDVLLKGYLPLPDGTQLAYEVHLPAAAGKFPVAMIMDHYSSGAQDPAVDTGSNFPGATLLAAGYAVLGVNQRGSGCSSGANNWVNAAQWGQDGADVVEWAAAQPWSTGHIGLFGISWPGITQIGTAGHRPPHLDAIAPFMITTDLYRDTAYPGGIYNAEFMSAYGALVPADDAQAANVTRGSTTVDTQCAINFATHAALSAPADTAVNMPQHPFVDGYWSNDPSHFVNTIDVPALGCQAWQDGDVSSRATELYMSRFNPATSWFVGRNGSHFSVACAMPQTGAMVVKFFDYYLKGVRNGWPSTPHVTLFHEVTLSGKSPTWTSTLQSWKAIRPMALHLNGDQTLGQSGPTGPEPSNAYFSVTPSASGAAWQGALVPGSFVPYTSAPLKTDEEFLGPASVNLWLSSTAPDTDVEVTISEVRPDGSDQYVASGWLRMSERKLGPKQSTALRPLQTHLQADQQLLTPLTPTFARVEVFPFDHVFRAGSRIQLTIDPAGGTAGATDDYRGFGVSAPAMNTIYQDSIHDSELVLGLVPGARAGAPEPACGDIASEPCRSPAP